MGFGKGQGGGYQQEEPNWRHQQQMLAQQAAQGHHQQTYAGHQGSHQGMQSLSQQGTSAAGPGGGLNIVRHVPENAFQGRAHPMTLPGANQGWKAPTDTWPSGDASQRQQQGNQFLIFNHVHIKFSLFQNSQIHFFVSNQTGASDGGFPGPTQVPRGNSGSGYGMTKNNLINIFKRFLLNQLTFLFKSIPK